MAVTVLARPAAVGVEYTVTVDSSADYSGVTTATTFYNIAEKKVYRKTSGGNIVDVFNEISGGIFSISDADGNPTYYDDLNTAIAAVPDGGTINVHADWTDTSTDAINMNKSYTINGNGFTATNTGTKTRWFYTSTTTQGLRINIYNYIIKDMQVVNNYCFDIRNTQNSIYDLRGSILYSEVSRVIRQSTNAAIKNKIIGGYYHNAVTNTATVVQLIDCDMVDARINGMGTGNSLSINNSTMYGSDITSDTATAITASGNGILVNCKVLAYSSFCYQPSSAGNMLRGCDLVSLANRAVNNSGAAANTRYTNCNIEAYAGQALFQNDSSTIEVDNCYLYSATANAILGYNFNVSNSRVISVAAATSLTNTGNAFFYNSRLSCNYDNAAGYILIGANGLTELGRIYNCVMDLTNATPAVVKSNNDTVSTVKFANNVVESGNDYFATNVSNGVATTADNQGNIKIS